MPSLPSKDITLELTSAKSCEEVLGLYEQAWRETLMGKPPPRIDAFLMHVAEADRAKLHAELQHIENRHQQRANPPVGTEVPVGTEILAPEVCRTEATLRDGEDGSRMAAGDATVDVPTPPEVSSDLGGVDFGGTVAHNPSAAAGSQTAATLDSEAASSSATDDGDFSVGPVKRRDKPAPIPSVAGYKILGVLGRGGMGIVFKARQAKLNRLVALKMVLAGAHASDHQLTRFFTEAEAVARLQHPNIVQIYEVGEHDGLPYFSLEYVDGGTLSEKIDGKPQPTREAAAIVEMLAYAMAAAHERGIIHRDLKPTNVLLNSDGLPKITDFGLAKRIEDDSSQTKSGTLMGTPSYMSPEQARGETLEIGPLSDVYSLGAILYELLTGRPPFVGTTMLETLAQVRSQEPVPPTRLQSKCPRDLETICLKCLQKEPKQRYGNCEVLADDLRHFLAGEPIKARPVGRVERVWRWCRRNPRVAALNGAVGVLALTVIAALVVVFVRMGREREALAETRKLAGQRLEQAEERIAIGNYQRAHDILHWSDPLLSHDELADVRAKLDTLKSQVDVYAEFRELLDNARFACRFGARRQKEEGRQYCHQLLALYDEIDGRTGRGAAGLPPLNKDQLQLFREDAFEALLTSAQIEQELAADGVEAQRQAAEKALEWLDRAEQLLPGTRALYVHRAPVWAKLGNHQANEADMERARSIQPTSAVDRFWHGFADHLRGDEAKGKKDLSTAANFYRLEIANYAAFLQMRPDHFWGYFNWANAHVNLNERPDLYDALIGFTACTRLRPDFPWPYNNRGTVHLRLGQPDLAVADFTAALARHENYALAYANRGLAYHALKRNDEALVDFTKAIALNPDYTQAYAGRAEIYRERKQDALAVQDYTRLLEFGDNKAALLEKRAAAYRALNQVDAAVSDFGELIQLNPKNLSARTTRAELLLAQEKYAAARDDFTGILEQAPRAAVVWRARAILNWQNLKEFDAALADFEKYSELAPKDAEPHRCVGVIHLGRRQYDAALDALQQSLTLRPDYPEAIWARAQIYLRQRQFANALKELEPLAAKFPEGPPETLNVRGGVYQAMGKLNEAAADYQRMIELKPKEPEAYVCLARVYEKQGQPVDAGKCFDRLVTAAPESKWAYVRRAENRRDHGEFDAALADCARAAGLAPGWSLPALVRASVEAARGQPVAAVADAERTLKNAPQDDGHVLYCAACVWSLAARATKAPAESQDYANRAADLLAMALDKGFHDLIYPEHNRIADDPALAPILGLPRVRELLDR
jgi:eukaryotic-like serine/threonine-protein kinase